MKTKIILTLMCVSTLFLVECKKGANDPGMSLKSRTGRLSGEWKLKSVNITNNFRNDAASPTVTTTTSYDGTNLTHTTSLGSTSSAYTMDVEIKKDGTYKQTIVEDSDTDITEGAWAWLAKNKSQDLKNKEAIVVTGLKYIDASYTDTYEGKSVYPDDIWVIDQLKSDELIILIDTKNTDTDGYIDESTGTYTFEKK